MPRFTISAEAVGIVRTETQCDAVAFSASTLPVTEHHQMLVYLEEIWYIHGPLMTTFTSSQGPTWQFSLVFPAIRPGIHC